MKNPTDRWSWNRGIKPFEETATVGRLGETKREENGEKKEK